MRRSWIFRLSLSVLCFAFILSGTSYVFTETASAAASYRLDPDMPADFWTGMSEEALIIRDSGGRAADIIGIEQSKAGIFRISRDPYLNEDDIRCYNIYIRPVKAGSTVFSISYINDHDEVCTMKRAFAAKDYPNEIKKLTVNGRVIKTSKKAVMPGGRRSDTRFGCRIRSSSSCASIRIRPKKGWKISTVRSLLSRGADDDIRDYRKVTRKSIGVKTIAEGKRIHFPKGWDELTVSVTMKNKKGSSIDYAVELYRY